MKIFVTARLRVTMSIVNQQLLFMKKKLIFLSLALTLSNYFLRAQNIGIGTPNPAGRLHVEQGNVLFNGPAILPVVPSPLPVSGLGTRLMWYPDKAAFRAGYVGSNRWDKDSIGQYSIAAGYDSKAKGSYTVAMGLNTAATGAVAVAIGYGVVAEGTAATSFGYYCNAVGDNSISMGSRSESNGDYSIALGRQNISGGNHAVAIGYFNSASNTSATAIGYDNIANGVYSTALGRGNVASGINAMALGTGCRTSGAFSTSFGRDCTASADNSTAFGQQATASGINSFSIGSYISTSGYTGAFALGDASTTTVMNSFVANGFRARFAGGYRLFTNSAVTIGAFLNANANSWAALSDVRMKENFLPVNGENFLQKIAAMPQYTWNYIGQDAATLRHYGPMAQDFFKAFGRDDLGEIGCDTLINQQDFLGVSFIAIQALEKRSAEQAKENELLKNKLLLLEEANKELAGKLILLNENMDATLKLVKELVANK